jgi:acetylornithine deacetylase/succinyl-diaminopimelate desuccinylase-like protein
MHGGVLRNPSRPHVRALRLAAHPDGRVNLPGFYDDVSTSQPWEREQLAGLGTDTEKYREFLGIPAFHTPPGYTPFEAVRFLPTLEFNGIGGGYQGEGTKTVIPSKAFVKITCRLVPNQTPDKMKRAASTAVRERVPAGCHPAHHRPARGDALRRGAARSHRTRRRTSRPCSPGAFRAGGQGGGGGLRPPAALPARGRERADRRHQAYLWARFAHDGLFLPEDNLHAPNESFHLGVMQQGHRDLVQRVLGAAKGRLPNPRRGRHCYIGAGDGPRQKAPEQSGAFCF